MFLGASVFSGRDMNRLCCVWTVFRLRDTQEQIGGWMRGPVCVCVCVLEWVSVCVSSVYRVCMGVRHRWTAGVSAVLNHSPLPSMQPHIHTCTHTHTHTHTHTQTHTRTKSHIHMSHPPSTTGKRPLKHSQLLLSKTAHRGHTKIRAWLFSSQ